MNLFFSFEKPLSSKDLVSQTTMYTHWRGEWGWGGGGGGVGGYCFKRQLIVKYELPSYKVHLQNHKDQISKIQMCVDTTAPVWLDQKTVKITEKNVIN